MADRGMMQPALSMWLANIVLIIIAILTPYYFSVPYAIHILIDVFSHSKHNFGIMLFWPFYKKIFGGILLSMPLLLFLFSHQSFSFLFSLMKQIYWQKFSLECL